MDQPKKSLALNLSIEAVIEAFQYAEHPSDKWSSYLYLYERYLGWRSPKTLVEVGVQKGGSLDMWGTLFPQTQIIGIDIDPACYDLEFSNPNIQVVIGDQGDPKFWDEFLVRFKDEGIDIFIDDGGHFMEPQILTIEKVWPKLIDDAVYIVEDTHTSYMSYNGGGLGRPGTFIEYAKSLIDVQHYNWKQNTTSDLETKRKKFPNLHGIHFHDSFVVLEKTKMYTPIERIANRDENGNKCLRVISS